MESKKLSKGEQLQTAMLELEAGEVLEVPYRFYSENTIRATASQLKFGKGVAYSVETRGAKSAFVTRLP